MSWTRASVHPPNQPRMTSYAALAPLFVVDISTVWTMLRRDCFLRAGALNCCTAEELPSGSANRVDWQGIRIPVWDPPVPAWRQRPGSRVVSWSTVTRSSGLMATSVCAAAASASGSGASDPAGPVPRRRAAMPVLRAFSRDGRTPWASVTAAPPSTRAPTTATAPTAVCVRRRVVPARRMMVTRGQRTSATWSRSGSNSGRMAVVGTSRCIANSAVASCSRVSASCCVSPTSRAMSAIETSASWVSRSTLRWVIGSLASASRVARMSGSSLRSRWKIRAEWRRCACRQASGRTQATGSSSRDTLRQWCQAATNASRTALREAGRSPVRAKVCWSSEVRVDL